MTTQLRIYTINRGKMDDFVAAWTKGVYPLRLKHGFKIEHAAVIEERNEFVWILTYDGPEDWETKEAEYYGSEARNTLDPDPRQYIARSDMWFLQSVVPPT